jgi:GMP synthase (glutamine-hydrolysing)
MTRPILCIRQHQPHELGVLAEAVDELGLETTYVDAWLAQTWPPIDDFSALVVLGGEMNADEVERFPFLSQERDLLARAIRQDMPVLGICLGAQLLARAAGAEVPKSPVPELGFLPVEGTRAGRNDPVLAPFDGIRVFQWHEDTFELPVGAELLCTNPNVPNQAFRIGRAAYGIQFHPEVTLEAIRAWSVKYEAAVRQFGRTPEDLVSEAESFVAAQRLASLASFGGFLELLDGR